MIGNRSAAIASLGLSVDWVKKIADLGFQVGFEDGGVLNVNATIE